MHTVKEKVSNAASAGKAHVEGYKAKLEEKAEQATARTEEEKEIAHQRRKAKEAEANMNLHLEKADHAAEKLHGKHHFLHQDPVVGGAHHHTTVAPTTAGTTIYPHHQQPPLAAVDPVTGATVPTHPTTAGGLFGGHKKHM